VTERRRGRLGPRPAFAKKIRKISGDEEEIISGVPVVLLSGHTPGITGYRISSGPDQLFVRADIMHVPHLQFAYPERIGSAYSFVPATLALHEADPSLMPIPRRLPCWHPPHCTPSRSAHAQARLARSWRSWRRRRSM
jgi:glyoxylase-like metal-dependent hydrolase (beta-lactamase superfamily II)